MISHRMVLWLALTSLSACAGANPPPAEEPTIIGLTLTKEQVQAVSKGVTASLKDPESARFGRMRGGQSSTGQLWVCGLVNAKNSYGGYVGMKPFAGQLMGLQFRLDALGSDDGTTYGVAATCNKRGLAPLVGE
jgi:hypothetical protein